MTLMGDKEFPVMIVTKNLSALGTPIIRITHFLDWTVEVKEWSKLLNKNKKKLEEPSLLIYTEFSQINYKTKELVFSGF